MCQLKTLFQLGCMTFNMHDILHALRDSWFKDTPDERNSIFIKFYNLLPNQNFEKNAEIYKTIAYGN